MREGVVGDGHGDEDDWHRFALGPAGLRPQFIKHWTNPKTGERAPIKRLLEFKLPIGGGPHYPSSDSFFPVDSSVNEASKRVKTSKMQIIFCNPACF